jgi:hypothetical protein
MVTTFHAWWADHSRRILSTVLLAAALSQCAFMVPLDSEPAPIPTVYATELGPLPATVGALHAPAPADPQPMPTVRYVSARLRPRISRSVRAAGNVWELLSRCESGGNWQANTGNGFYGGVQFTASSWRWVGGHGLPHEASKAEQIHRAQILQSRIGWRRGWPACSRRLGLA